MKTAIITQVLDGHDYIKGEIRFNETTASATYPARLQGTLLAGIAKDAIRAYVREKMKPFSMNFVTNSGTFNVIFS